MSASAALALAPAFAGLGATPASAAPLPMDQCTTTSGVVLAVDFGHWGGPLLRSCGTTPTTGYALLNQGGWRTTGTGHDGPAFICRIGYSGHQGGKQYPTPEQDKCVKTPPATAYWSYWHADPGQDSWSYSQLGAMSYQPVPGSVDLWIFGGTDIGGAEGRPTVSPDSLRAHNTTPGGNASNPTPPPGGSTGGGTGTGGTVGGTTNSSTSGGAGSRPSSPPGTTTRGAGSPAPAGTSTGTAPPEATPQEGSAAPSPTEPPPTPTPPPSPDTSGTSTGTPPASPSPSASGLTPVDAAPVADAPHAAGSMAPAAVGAAIVLVLGVATAVTALRRRRRAE
ncbi:hypothetical protein ACIA8O_36345 [Kitasatospora sp. NPDC051853]|uniref:hypothetical protein n=1 Tax=Kitasatospora sp. NPDC051853 TaxID=3364058 RepID=UPI00378E13F7